MKPARLGALILAVLSGLTAAADNVLLPGTMVQNGSGQIMVHGAPDSSPLLRRYPGLKNEPALILWDAPTLAVAADRARVHVWRRLGCIPNAPWTGRIYFNLRPARTVDEPVQIIAHAFGGGWDYRVELPDLADRLRSARALAGVVLQEMANRGSPVDAGTATVPAWLVDGFAQDLLADDSGGVLLGVAENFTEVRKRGRDLLAAARPVLQQNEPLTFAQLSWPTEHQEAMGDGGVYFASAQVLVSEVLALPNGPARMRSFLAQLPSCMNWQTAFLAAFHDEFRTPLDVEKWWSLRLVTFTARNPGPGWTLATSRNALDALLHLPAESRSDTNALPEMREVSLAEAVRTFPPATLRPMLEVRLRELELVRIRLAPGFQSLAQDYIITLADLLGKPRHSAGADRRESSPRQQATPTQGMRHTSSVVKQLTALDARRLALEAQLDRKKTPPTRTSLAP